MHAAVASGNRCYLLFLYSEKLDLSFHTVALNALLRVTHEARIFPLVTLDRKWSSHVDPFREYLEQAGFEVEVVTVEYAFLRTEHHAGNRMMRIGRGTGL